MVDREITTPFGLDSSGRIATTTDPAVRGRQKLLAYLVTSPGERVMRPAWGTRLKDSVFNTFGPVENELLTGSVSDAVARDVRGARVVNLAVGSVSDEGVLPVAVEFAMVVGDGSVSTTETTIIQIGGA